MWIEEIVVLFDLDQISYQTKFKEKSFDIRKIINTKLNIIFLYLWLNQNDWIRLQYHR